MKLLQSWAILVAAAIAVNVYLWSVHRHLNRFALVVTLLLIISGIANNYLASPGGMARKATTLQAQKEHPYVPGRYDFLGWIWLAAIPIAPAIGWIVTEAVGVNKSNWITLLGIRVFLTIVLPFIGVVPLIRFVRGPNLVLVMVFLIVGTLFPVMTGLGSAFDLVRGPAWEQVEITKIEDIIRVGKGSPVVSPQAIIRLADGRMLSRAKPVRVHLGPANLCILRSLERIIDSR